MAIAQFLCKSISSSVHFQTNERKSEKLLTTFLILHNRKTHLPDPFSRLPLVKTLIIDDNHIIIVDNHIVIDDDYVNIDDD